MAMFYTAAFDVSDTNLSLGTITVGGSGLTNAAVTIANVRDADVDTNTANNASVFWHYEPTGAGSSTNIRVESQHATALVPYGYMSRRSFARALQADLRAAMDGTWTPGSFTISWSRTTGAYTIAYSSAITVTWSTSGGRSLLGFAADVSVAAASSTGTVPTFCIEPTLDTVSRDTLNYEPSAIATRAVTDSGQGGGMARTVSPLYRDWVQEFETKEKTSRLHKTGRWSFQELFEHCREGFPFAVIAGFGESSSDYDEAFSLRTEGTRWAADEMRATPGNDSQFHIPFQTIVEGYFRTF